MRATVLSSLLSLCLIGLCCAQNSNAATRKDLNVPAEDLSPALQTVATTYEIQLLYPTQLTKDLKTHGAAGTFTADQALTQVLSGTGLSYKYLDASTVTVFSASQSASSSTSSASDQGTPPRDDGGGKKSSQDFRVAQVDQAGAGNQTVDQSKEQTVDQSKEKKKEYLEEVVVTGTRIPTAAGQQTLPVHVYTREDIESSGQVTMGDYLNTLPNVSNFQSGILDTSIAGLQTVQLHGLPVGTTLTLLDGQRMETSTIGFFDLSTIPLAAIERIEILPVGASAIYGADALAGAVNFILRKNFNGFEFNASVNHGAGFNDAGANFAWGKSWERGSITLIGTYQGQGELSGDEREPANLAHFPGDPSALVRLSSDSCAPGNVYSVDGSNLPGLSSAMAGIPTGIIGTPTVAQFAATAGKQNVCNLIRYRDITPRSQMEGAFLSAHFDLADSIEMFSDVLFSHRRLSNNFAPQLDVEQGTVTAANPYNPFGVPVNVSFAYPGTGTPETQSATLIRPLLGVQGSLFTDWRYEVTAFVSRDQLHDVELFADPFKIADALASSDPATALNPFASGAPGSPQLLASLTDPAQDSNDNLFDQRITSAQGHMGGTVLHLPSGAVQAVVGAEYLKENQVNNFGPFLGSPAIPLSLHRTAYGVFGEARLPLLAEPGNSNANERLALTSAGRYDHSDDYGGKVTWQSGLFWRLGPSLSFSGSYGTSYQAPQLTQISGPISSFPANLGAQGITDPFRGNEPVDYTVLTTDGSNPNLKPETGESLNLGLSYSSQTVSGLQASLNWYDIRISNYIGLPNTQAIIDNPNLFPGAVVRAPPTAQDQQQGFLGEITEFHFAAASSIFASPATPYPQSWPAKGPARIAQLRGRASTSPQSQRTSETVKTWLTQHLAYEFRCSCREASQG